MPTCTGIWYALVANLTHQFYVCDIKKTQATRTMVSLIKDSAYLIQVRTTPGWDHARLGPRKKIRSLQGLLESTKENSGSQVFFEIISLKSKQKC